MGESSTKKPWSKEWLSEIDPDNLADDPHKIIIFPLQFANCDRLERHSAVYLFDEVGCGKTISAGLMALHYLYNKPGKHVLVITVNALVTTDKLQDDWGKLSFDRLGLQGRFTAINNHYSNIEKELGKRDWGLIIVDEAHLFLNRETKRYEALCKLKAEKVVFLTATPVKDFCHFNMNVYTEIAKSITGTEPDSKWIDRISTQGKAPEEIICQTFSLDIPATRYFKDTVKALTVEGFRHPKARRMLPDIWFYTDYKTRFAELAVQINNTLSDKPEAHFVVFVRLTDDADEIGEALKQKGFCQFQDQTGGGRSYKIVIEKSGNLKPFRKKNGPLPTVLIITYQLAEQGVDLPGYSHVVNVHIPAYPSALEQRFGRIDRMGDTCNDIKDIKMHFFLGKNRFWDSNTINLHMAIFFYLTNLISYLPAKNSVLTSDILKKSKETQKEAERYLTQAEDTIRAWTTGTEDPKLTKLVKEFCQDHGIPWIEEDKADCVKDAEEKLKALRKAAASKFDPESYSELLDKCTGNKIFYFTQLPEDNNLFPSSETVSQNIQFLDAVGCAEKVTDNEDYKTYLDKFRKEVNPLLCFVKYQDKLETWYEERFRENKIEEIFKCGEGFDLKAQNLSFLNLPPVYCFCKKIVRDDNEIKVLWEGFRQHWRRLPFFQMCGAFAEELKDCCLSNNRNSDTYGCVKRQFKSNPFWAALDALADGVNTARDWLHYGHGDWRWKKWSRHRRWARQLSDEFYAYLETIRRTARTENPFRIENKDGKRLASNWLRLAVHLTCNKQVRRRNGEQVSVLRGFLHSQSGPRWNESWWSYGPNLPWKAETGDPWTDELF